MTMPKDEDLAVHPGKKKEMSIKDNHQALRLPFTRGISKADNTPVLNSTALGEQVGLELSGRQQVRSEPSIWKGRIKKCTTRHS